MIYLIITYIVGVFLLFMFAMRDENDIDSSIIISLLWPIVVPFIIILLTARFLKDLFREMFKEEPDEAFRDYRDLPHPPKTVKEPKQFKFGR